MTADIQAELRRLWRTWNENEQLLRRAGFDSKASTQRMCMEDLERLAEKYGWDVTK